MTPDRSEGPSLAVDVIVRIDRRILLIERRNEPTGWAIPGGFVEKGETVETAARREIREELSVELEELRRWKVFSDPERDPREHVVSVCFKARGTGQPRAGTDAANARAFSSHKPWPELVFDHRTILEDYVTSESIPYLNHREDER